MKMKNEQNIEQRVKKARSLQLAACSLKNSVALCEYSATSVVKRIRQLTETTENTKETQRNTEKTRSLWLAACSLQLAACSLEEENSTVQHSNASGNRGLCICNSFMPVVSNTGEGVEELAFRACELLLN